MARSVVGDKLAIIDSWLRAMKQNDFEILCLRTSFGSVHIRLVFYAYVLHSTYITLH